LLDNDFLHATVRGRACPPFLGGLVLWGMMPATSTSSSVSAYPPARSFVPLVIVPGPYLLKLQKQSMFDEVERKITETIDYVCL